MIRLLTFIAIFIFVPYLIFSFVMWDFDVITALSNLGNFGRGVVISIWLVFTIPAIPIFLDK